MDKIRFKTKVEFDLAVSTIEEWSSSKTPKVTYVGKGKMEEPDLTKPYTLYDKDELTINSDEFIIELLKEKGIEYIDLKSYDQWKVRVDIVNTLRTRAEESPLAVPAEDFYQKHQESIKAYMDSGTNELLIAFQESTDSRLDLREDNDPSNASPREVAISLLKSIK